MENYFPKSEKSKRKKIEVALKPLIKELTIESWLFDALELQLKDQQVEKLDKDDFHARSLAVTIEDVLADVSQVGKDFTILRILMNDGLIPSEDDIKKQLAEELPSCRNIFACCQKITEVDLNIISSFEMLLDGYFNYFSIKNKNQSCLCPRVLGCNADEDIFQLAHKQGRLPDIHILLKVIKKHSSQLLYLPQSINNMILDNEQAKKEYVEIIKTLSFGDLKKFLSFNPGLLSAAILDVEKELTPYLKHILLRDIPSIEVLRLLLAMQSKQKSLIIKYAKRISWDKISQLDVKFLFGFQKVENKEIFTAILMGVPSFKILDIGLQMQNEIEDPFKKLEILPNIVLTLLETTPNPIKDLVSFIKNGKKLIETVPASDNVRDMSRHYEKQQSWLTSSGRKTMEDYYHNLDRILDFRTFTNDVSFDISELLYKKDGVWLYEVFADIFKKHYQKIDQKYFSFLFVENEGRLDVPLHHFDEVWVLNAHATLLILFPERVCSREFLLKELINTISIPEPTSTLEGYLQEYPFLKMNFIERDAVRALTLSQNDFLFKEVIELQKKDKNALLEFEWFMYIPLFNKHQLNYTLQSSSLLDFHQVVEQLIKSNGPEATWGKHFFSLVYHSKTFNRDLIVEVFRSVLSDEKLYLISLRAVLDDLWRKESYYLDVQHSIQTVLGILFEKHNHIKLLIGVTYLELKSRNYANDFEKDLVFADVATIFLERNTFRPDLGIDELLIQRFSKFLIDLRATARNEGEPPTGHDVYMISYAATILCHFKGAWPALKSLLLLFRALPKQSVTLDSETDNQKTFLWHALPQAITWLIGSISKNDEDSQEVRLKWFKDLAERLKPVDKKKVQSRNYEKVLSEYEEGFAPTLKEPHPVWRVAYCEAAGDLKVNPGNKGRYVFEKVKLNDPDEEVKATAERIGRRVAKIKTQLGVGSHKTALMNAWWWYRMGHIISTGGEVDRDLAEKIRSREVRRNYFER